MTRARTLLVTLLFMSAPLWVLSMPAAEAAAAARPTVEHYTGSFGITTCDGEELVVEARAIGTWQYFDDRGGGFHISQHYSIHTTFVTSNGTRYVLNWVTGDTAHNFGEGAQTPYSLTHTGMYKLIGTGHEGVVTVRDLFHFTVSASGQLTVDTHRTDVSIDC